ncbi:MAG: DNA repair exonuclease [Fimbriimonadaceae bacterium]|nr:DNA repair exonuclease [Fimbriimonadaceae bacterium]
MARFLVGGDFHLGRSSSIPAFARGEVAGRDLTARGAWYRFVDLAVRERPDAVLLTGDLVDRDFGALAALPPLREGFRRLREAGIPTVVIAGNHDPNILRAYARQYPDDAVFLGRSEPGFATHRLPNGWTVVGWSYPASPDESARVPWSTFPKSLGGRSIGMLHGTLGGGDRYAPFTLTELRDHPTDLWCLGHIHKPYWNPAPAVLYPGAPQALDPGETGPHGAVRMTWKDGGWTHEPVLLSTVRYENTTLTVTESDTIALAVIDQLARLAEEDSVPYWVVRAQVVGEQPAHAAPFDSTPLATSAYAAEFTGVALGAPVDWVATARSLGRDGICAQLYLLATGTHTDQPDLIRPEVRELYQTLTHLRFDAASRKGDSKALNDIYRDPEALRALLADACRGWVRS